MMKRQLNQINTDKDRGDREIRKQGRRQREEEGGRERN